MFCAHPLDRLTASHPTRRAFTLVELVIVFGIMTALIALLIPAVNSAREAARRNACVNNVQQLTLAVQAYEHTHGAYPPSWTPNGWSAHVRLLPFIDELPIYQMIDMRQSYAESLSAGGAPVGGINIPMFRCPSNGPTAVFKDASGRPAWRGSNYVVNCGVWFVWDPQTDDGGAGAFYPNSQLRPRDFTDGRSHTLCFSESVTQQDLEKNAGAPGHLPPPAWPSVTLPRGTIAAQRDATTLARASWVDGSVHQTGFTSILSDLTAAVQGPPPGIPQVWTNQIEGTSPMVRTYSAAPVSSKHSGGIISSRMDGSVRMEGATMGPVWRALSTRAGRELMSGR